MDELGPWRDSTDEGHARAASLVQTAASIGPAPVDLSSWDEVVARHQRSGRDGRLLPAFGLSLVAGMALVVWLFPRAAPLPPPEPPVMVASASARWSQGADGVLSLEAGRLSVERTSAARVVVKTPHAVIEATRARFLAEVTAGGTTLVVEEGEVVLRGQDQSRTVKAGQTLVWPETPRIPEPLEARSTTVTPVCEGPGSRLECLRLEAAGEGLTAQAALYELGRFELGAGRSADALAAWTTSLARFPDGVLHPEVRLALLVELTRQRRFDEAMAVARAFEAACSTDPRLVDVQSLRRSLEAR